jgi:hypothetical protein
MACCVRSCVPQGACGIRSVAVCPANSAACCYSCACRGWCHALKFPGTSGVEGLGLQLVTSCASDSERWANGLGGFHSPAGLWCSLAGAVWVLDLP